MIVQKSKKSRSRRGHRRAHDFLTVPVGSQCPETGEYVLAHRVSPMGWYKGKKLFLTKEEKKAEKAEATADAKAPAKKKS